MATKLSEVARAWQRCDEPFKALHDLNGREMECTQDKAGIVWVRFYMPWGESIILFSTPTWWDLFAPVSSARLTAEVIDALKARAAPQVPEPER